MDSFRLSTTQDGVARGRPAGSGTVDPMTDNSATDADTQDQGEAEREPAPLVVQIDVGIGPAHVGAFVRRTRRTADLSQRDLAKRTGVSPALIGAIERDKVTPSLATLQRILATADYQLVVCDAGRRLVLPLQVWQDVADGAGRRYPAHLDTILDPVFGEWWADVYGLQAPPETFRRSRAWRDWQRSQSRWDVRVQQLRWVPRPRRPRREVEWGPGA